jgi:histone acetyltransferase (RNA polymerase elongator complex component)
MNRGCPHRCIFCNERLTAGNRSGKITDTAFAETVRAHLNRGKRKDGPVQIAFYGGTFTGMDRNEQRRLLKLAEAFLREGAVDGIRISTRPDEIDAEGLDLLRTHSVTTVEVGAQSLDDEVLLLSQRGHTAADTIRALVLLKKRGFETGLHLMVGLPGDNPDRFAETIRRVIDLRPDTVRIHPTLVLRDTPLAEIFKQGKYLPLTLSDAVNFCKDALKALTAEGIPVIRLGLQTTRELEEPGAVIAGPFHPSFRSLVETALFLDMATALLFSAGQENGAPVLSAHFILSPADLSNFYGRGRENIKALRHRFGLCEIRVSSDPDLPRLSLILTAGDKRIKTDCSGKIFPPRRI